MELTSIKWNTPFKLKQVLLSCALALCLGRGPRKIIAPWKKIFQKIKRRTYKHYLISEEQHPLNDCSWMKFRNKLFSQGSGKCCFLQDPQRICPVSFAASYGAQSSNSQGAACMLLLQCCSPITSRTSWENACCRSMHVKITATRKIEFWRYLDIWNSMKFYENG